MTQQFPELFTIIVQPGFSTQTLGQPLQTLLPFGYIEKVFQLIFLISYEIFHFYIFLGDTTRKQGNNIGCLQNVTL